MTEDLVSLCLPTPSCICLYSNISKNWLYQGMTSMGSGSCVFSVVGPFSGTEAPYSPVYKVFILLDFSKVVKICLFQKTVGMDMIKKCFLLQYCHRYRQLSLSNHNWDQQLGKEKVCDHSSNLQLSQHSHHTIAIQGLCNTGIILFLKMFYK